MSAGDPFVGGRHPPLANDVQQHHQDALEGEADGLRRRRSVRKPTPARNWTTQGLRTVTWWD
jgi:hypothetical protein